MKRSFPFLLITLALWSFACPSRAEDKALGYCEAGNLFYGQKKYDQAIHYYESAIQADPNFWQAYQGEGSCYYARGEKAKCLPYYQKALSLNRNNPSLAAFVQSLRAQVDQAKTPTPQPTPQQFERERMLRQAYEISVDHFEMSSALGAAFDDSVMGLGGSLSGYYMLDPQFGIGAIFGVYILDSSFSTPFTYNLTFSTLGTGSINYSGTVTSMELITAVKYRFGGKKFEPYVVIGSGFANLSVGLTTSYNYKDGPPSDGTPYSSLKTSGSQNFPMWTVGGGLEYKLDPDVRLFLEGRLDVILGNGSSTTIIPLEGGLNFRM